MFIKVIFYRGESFFQFKPGILRNCLLLIRNWFKEIFGGATFAFESHTLWAGVGVCLRLLPPLVVVRIGLEN